MATTYLIIVCVLFLLAISDLIVGVSNDAVNFLNSAVGSKAATFKTIMIIAAIGVLVGATFSSGMMEVARKGIFHPQHFVFEEIMIIFLAVMITDVILLDLFNTFGLPTSTTVSIVFELLGAAVAVAWIKVSYHPDGMAISDYINSAKALAIISGILLSVIIAFTAGVIIQFLSRLAFSFNYEKRLKYIGGLFGGIALTAITYFILIKGSKGASFMSSELKDLIKTNSFLILSLSLVGWTIILQIAAWMTKFDILKFVVLAGTFALAMAFAGNDLVNFIGVPLAGYASFLSFIGTEGVSPDTFLMTDLARKLPTPTLYLLIAGLIMVITLWTSKKAKSVVKTSLDLSRQDEGFERFGSSWISRSIVRSFSNFAMYVTNQFVPTSIRDKMLRQFDETTFVETQLSQGKDAPSFDKVRAAVTLIVAAVLISIGTNLKLPLSTTYVTFMVAMGTSLADGAWGRASAVYRVSGVLSVIGGWFFTAFSAFLSAFIIALIFSYGGIVAIVLMIFLAGFVVFRTHKLHVKKVKEQEQLIRDYTEELLDNKKIFSRSTANIVSTVHELEEIIQHAFSGLTKENLKLLNKTFQKFNLIDKKVKSMRDNVYTTITKLEEHSIESGHHYVQVMDYLREISHSTLHIVDPCLQYVDNHHKPLSRVQLDEIKTIESELNRLFKAVTDMISNLDYKNLDPIRNSQNDLLNVLQKIRKEQIKRIKRKEVGTRNSVLFLSLLAETKNITLHIINLLKSHRDFVIFMGEHGSTTEDVIIEGQTPYL